MVRQTQEQRRATTRRGILDAAARLFATDGYDAVSVDHVARHAGRTSGAVYDHFGSKHGVLLAILEESRRDTRQLVGQEVRSAAAPDAQLGALWSSLTAGEAARRRVLFERDLWLRGMRDQSLRDSVRARARETRDRVGGELRSWAESVGGTPPFDDGALATVVTAFLVGLESQELLEPGSVDGDAVVRALGLLLGTSGAT